MFRGEMFTNCDFSAADRVPLLQKATKLTMNASQLKQTLLEKGHVYDPCYLGLPWASVPHENLANETPEHQIKTSIYRLKAELHPTGYHASNTQPAETVLPCWNIQKSKCFTLTLWQQSHIRQLKVRNIIKRPQAYWEGNGNKKQLSNNKCFSRAMRLKSDVSCAGADVGKPQAK